MISRSVQSGNICLRCQLRLLEGPRPGRLLRHRPLPQLIHTRFRRCYSSTPAWDRLASASQGEKDGGKNPKQRTAEREKNELSESEQSNVPDEATFAVQTGASVDGKAIEPEEAPSISRPEPRVPQDGHESPDTSESLLQQLAREVEQGHESRMFRRDPLEERDTIHRGRVGSRRVVLKPESLNINMLGEKAHTIVMRDDRYGKPRREILEDPNPPLPSETTSADLQAFLAAAEAEPSNEEAIANIEELRPESNLMLRSDFWTLHSDLAEGFTNNQLVSYIAKQRKNAGRKTASGTDTIPEAPKGYTIRPLEKIEVPPDMSPKARKALALMLDSWKVDIWERVEGLSDISVAVKDPAVAMVLNFGRERNQRLDALRSSLQAGESLVWNPEKKTLKIVARRAIIETIMDEVNSITENIAEGTISLFPSSGIKSKEAMAMVDPLLNQLCHHTRAAFSPASRNGKIRALWVKNEADVDSSDFEGLDHVMWRLLYTAHARPESSMTILEELQTIGIGRLDLHTRNEERLPWKDRMTSWARWVLPVDRQALGLSNVDNLASKISALEKMQKDESERLSKWPPSQASISTTFGHVLFEAPQESQDIKSILMSTTNGTLVPRILAPVTPPPNGLKPLGSLLADTSASTTMVLRFAAGPDHIKTPLLVLEDGSTSLHPSAAARYVVELHLDVPEDIPDDGVLTWDSSPRKSVRAILATSHSDLPLPDRPVDVRITQTQTSIVTDADSIPSLREFIDSSHLNLSSGILRTPSTLQIPQDELTGLPASRKPSTSESLEFLGLEVRRAVHLPYEGHNLSYTSVEAGLHGGRRAELSLAMTCPESGVDEVEHRQQYLNLAIALTEGRLVHWGDGPHVISEDARLQRSAEEPQMAEGTRPGEVSKEDEADK